MKSETAKKTRTETHSKSAEKLTPLKNKLEELEEGLRWTRKRLLFWEMLIWHLYDLVPPETFPLKDILDGYTRETLIAEREMKARLSRGITVRIVDPESGEEVCRMGSEQEAHFIQRAEKLKAKNTEEIIREFRDELAEVYGEVLKGEIRGDNKK